MSGMRRLLMGPVASGYQSQPLFRFAAWSVTVAPKFTATWKPGGATVLVAAFLPGLCQTAYRAEPYMQSDMP